MLRKGASALRCGVVVSGCANRPDRSLRVLIVTSAVGGALLGVSRLLFARQGPLAWFLVVLAAVGALLGTVMATLLRRRS